MAIPLRELAIDSTGDLALVNGDLVLNEGAAAVAQRAQVRLKTWLGEWRFDRRLGTPWLEAVLGKPIDESLVQALLANRIRQTQGVARIQSMRFRIDSTNQSMRVSGRIIADDGEDAVVTALL